MEYVCKRGVFWGEYVYNRGVLWGEYVYNRGVLWGRMFIIGEYCGGVCL